MKNRKLILILKNLSPKEWKALERYLQNPFFNTNEKVLQLFTLLQKAAPHFDVPWLSEAHLLIKLYPEKKALKMGRDDSKLRVTMSRLFEMVNDFLLYQHFKKDEAYQDRTLLLELLIRKQHKAFLQKIRHTLQKQKEQEIQSIHFYQHQHHLEELLHAFTFRNRGKNTALAIKKQLNLDPQNIHNLERLSHSFDTYFILSKLQMACAALTRQNIFEIQQDILFLDEIVHLVAQHSKLLEQPSIAIYYHTVRMYKNESDTSLFQEFLAMLQNGVPTVSTVEMTNFYRLGINYCNQKLLKGDTFFRQPLFELYLKGAEKGYLLRGQNIHPRELKNVVVSGARAGQFKQAIALAKKYRKFVLPKYQDSIYFFNMAACYFYQNQFEKAWKALFQVEIFYDTMNQADCKNLWLKIYYETGENELFEATIQNFKQFVRNHKEINTEKRQGYTNFANQLLRLYHIKNELQLNKAKLERLKNAILKKPLNSDKEWLLDKVKALL